YSRPMRTSRLDSASKSGGVCSVDQVAIPVTTTKTTRTVHLPRARLDRSSRAAASPSGRSGSSSWSGSGGSSNTSTSSSSSVMDPPPPRESVAVVRVQAVGEADVEGQVLAQVQVDPLVHVGDRRGGHVHDVEGLQREVPARALALENAGEVGVHELVSAVLVSPHDEHVLRAGARQEAAGLEHGLE